MSNRTNRKKKRAAKLKLEHIEQKLKLKASSELKRQVFYALENPSKGRTPAKIIGYSLFILIILNAIIVFFAAQPGLDPIATNIISAFYTFSTVCFAIEYIARIWIADLAIGDVSRIRARLKYIVSALGIIDLLSFLPNVIAWFFPLTPLMRNVINLVRLVRIIKISRYMRGLRTISRVIVKRKSEIVGSFLVILLLIVVASVVMYEVEHKAQPDKFDSLLTGVWWAVQTITSTGYGDIVPITAAGRFIGSIVMLLSVALVAIPGGIFSAGFVAEFQNATNRRIEREIHKVESTDSVKLAQKDTANEKSSKSN